MCKSVRTLKPIMWSKDIRQGGAKVKKVFAGRHSKPVIIGLWSQRTCFRKKLPGFEQAHYDPKPTSYCGWQQNIKNEAHTCTNVLCKIDKKEFQEERLLQGEHKVFPWLQTFITRKLRGIQTYFFLQLLKLVSNILCHVFIVTFGFWMQHFQTGGLGRWSDTLATTLTGYHPSWLLFMGVC